MWLSWFGQQQQHSRHGGGGILFLLLVSLLLSTASNAAQAPEQHASSSSDPSSPRTRIAIIGQGISGAFTAKYLADYYYDYYYYYSEQHENDNKDDNKQEGDNDKEDCSTNSLTPSITILEAAPLSGPILQRQQDDSETITTNQGSRVSSVAIEAGGSNDNSNDDNPTNNNDNPKKNDKHHPYNIELGSAVGHSGCTLVLDMIQSSWAMAAEKEEGKDNQGQDHYGNNDDHPVVLQLAAPYETSLAVGDHDDNEDDTLQQQRTMGLYSGHHQWAFRTFAPSWFSSYVGSATTTWLTQLLNQFQLYWRYHLDWQRVTKLARHVHQATADELPQLLESTFLASPDQMWQRVGLLPLAHTSYAHVLDVAQVGGGSEYEQEYETTTTTTSSWWWWPSNFGKWLGRGSLRDELLTAIQWLYCQDSSALHHSSSSHPVSPHHHINALTGLQSFAAYTNPKFSIRGGNHALIRSALWQANRRLQKARAGCRGNAIQQKSQRVTHVIGSLQGLTLFATTTTTTTTTEQRINLGTFDIVVLAAPLQQAQIEFTVQSQFDSSVLQPMPLGGLIPNLDGDETQPNNDKDDDEAASLSSQHEGHDTHPSFLPESAQRPYIPAVTTILSGGSLQPAALGLEEASDLPRTVLFTAAGKAALYNITTITRIRGNIYRVVSKQQLSREIQTHLFGPNVTTEFVKVWSGAAPDYRGQGQSTPFLLYDGSEGIAGHGGALYYPNAMELSSLSSMEMSAVGAKAVAKLIAKRVRWIQQEDDREIHDEL